MGYKVLLLNPNARELKEDASELSNRGLDVASAVHLEEARELLLKDGHIQVVLTEWAIPVDTKGRESLKGMELFRSLADLRYEVNIFLFTRKQDWDCAATGGIISGFFDRNENDYEDIIQKVKSHIATSKMRAPFFEALVGYARMAKDAWHTPGHSGGQSIKNSEYASDFYDFFGENMFQSDLSVSVPMLDSLLDPKGVIQEAQELAARAFNARYTYFSTNGTSTANKVLLQAILKPGDAILLDRNCHKSVHYGIVISGAEPLYLTPSVNDQYGIFGPVPKKAIFEGIEQALKAGKKLKALILTNCTYDGLIYDIKDIVDKAHQHGIKVIVDEAWFGHANFHPLFYPCAMAAGADYATQSTHKIMSAFSQASMIHVADPDFESNRDFFQENFNMHTSTSPGYALIASLDVARKQMVMEGFTLLQKALELAEKLRISINSLKKFRVLDLEDLISDEVKDDNVRLDPTKITIDVSQSGYSSREIEHLLLTKHSIQIEKTTFNTLTVLITIGSTYSKVHRLFLALESIEHMSGTRTVSDSTKTIQQFKLKVSPLRFFPRAAFYAQSESLPARVCVGRISTAMVVPYPPGIPLLVPGQLITEEIVNVLLAYRDYGIEIHGMHDGILRVITKVEEEALTKQGSQIPAVADVC